MKTKSIFFCLVFALCLNINTSNAQIDVQDSLALVDLYKSTDGPNWYNNTNWLSSNPVSTWYGITVTGARVTSLSLGDVNLGGNNLRGTIPPSIGNLAGLTRLALGFNQLSDTIPSSIGKLTNLQYLYLYRNQLSGSIPSSIGNLVNLTDLELGPNQLSGSIPSSIGNLSHLSYLSLSGNQLSGNIPSSIGNLTNLQYLYLYDNQLSGSIPTSIGNLVNLTASLWLNDNQLSGNIPSSIGNLVNLHYLLLHLNHLSGAVPSSIGKLVNLQELHLNNNRLSGSIPSSIGNLVHNSYLNLRYNYFTFDGMELIGKEFTNAYYDHQRKITVHQNGNTLSVSAGGTLSNNTYKWFKYDGTTYTLVAILKADSTFHPSESGRYRVKVLNSVATQLQLYSKLFDYTAPNSAVIASAQNSLQQNDKTNLFLVYPNPARDILHIETKGNTSFSLLDQSGKILLTKSINGNGEINVTNLAAGLYYLKNNSTSAVQKVVIAR